MHGTRGDRSSWHVVYGLSHTAFSPCPETEAGLTPNVNAFDGETSPWPHTARERQMWRDAATGRFPAAVLVRLVEQMEELLATDGVAALGLGLAADPAAIVRRLVLRALIPRQ